MSGTSLRAKGQSALLINEGLGMDSSKGIQHIAHTQRCKGTVQP